MTDSARPEGGLSKQERLCGKREIATLLEHGRWGGSACLRFCCRVRTEETEVPDRMMVSVPKKHFKRAVRLNINAQNTGAARNNLRQFFGCIQF